MNHKKSRAAVYAALFVLVLLVPDRLTKKWAAAHLQQQTVSVVENMFSLRYVENQGIGFGLFSGRVPVILIANGIILLLIMLFLWRLPVDRRMMPVRIVLLFTVAGALGNMIDRIRLGYVIDFLSFDLIHFPVFNVADIYVTCSVILLAMMYLFYFKPGELEAAILRKKDIQQDTQEEARSVNK